ncbi:hypothetical protein BGZ61DRAFT_488245 [Ilyonectria robusta]|uniref:uncharacterized protein n=1 Tax=Ilyonectria robusta TaxID=1079257 RepID=UPI001E8D89CC|nr:uncharacterized protein BGZ61DRAFT_488245 [Ilyonectria robusta]KAH8646457.1 hypothetical protein BGZ61DRAFT_488245 [Ilyonectria robusta]
MSGIALHDKVRKRGGDPAFILQLQRGVCQRWFRIALATDQSIGAVPKTHASLRGAGSIALLEEAKGSTHSTSAVANNGLWPECDRKVPLFLLFPLFLAFFLIFRILAVVARPGRWE